MSMTLSRWLAVVGLLAVGCGSAPAPAPEASVAEPGEAAAAAVAESPGVEIAALPASGPMPATADSTSAPVQVAVDSPLGDAETASGSGLVTPVPPEPVPPEVEIERTLAAWAQAWSEKRVEDYLSFYGAAFEPRDGMSHLEWLASRRDRLEAPQFIEVTISQPSVLLLAPERARVEFVQSYRSDTYNDRVRKTLELVRDDTGWRIVREDSQPLPAGASAGSSAA